MADVQTETELPRARLMHFPVPMFAIVMGLMGLALALHSADATLPVAGILSVWVTVAGIVVFGVIALFYVAKLLRHPQAVVGEWNHPVRLAFFPAISISMLLIATALLPQAEDMARLVWIVGTAFQGVLTLAVISGWISHRSFQVGQLTPAWFIPAVGNVVVPIAGGELGYVELSWLFFSTGMIFWIVLLTLVFNRLIFHDPIPGKLLPTLVILVAPPAIGFLAYLSLNGGVDGFARVLLNAGYVFAALVAVQAPKFRRLPFALPWWALSFPVAALTIASFRFAAVTGSGAHEVIGLGLLAVLILIMAGLIYRTCLAVLRGEICVPE